MSRTTLHRSRLLHRPQAALAISERTRKLAVFLTALGSTQHRRASGRTRQAILALSTALLGSAALVVVGARASEPAADSAVISLGQSIDPPPLLLRPLAKSAAIALNESIPFAKGVRYPAAPFKFTGDPEARERATQCLTAAIYYEAASESDQGEQAVAQVVLNRVRSPSFPSSICSVVYQGSLLKTGCQFSFTCDGSLQREALEPEWLRARQIAEAALNGAVMSQVGLSTHYHTIDVVPYWATSLAKEVQVGRHIFYAWPGRWGELAAFRQRYAGTEPDPARLRDTALVAKGIWPAASDDADLPPIEVTSDPKVEAAAIVDMLGREPASQPSALEAEAREYFLERPAVMASDKLAFDSETDAAPVVAATVTEGGDLATSSKMREFLRAHRRDYKGAALQAEQDLRRLAADWQTYTGSTIAKQRINLRLTDSLSEPRCTAPALADTKASQAIEPADYDLFVASGLPKLLLPITFAAWPREEQTAKLIDAVRTDIVFAVFARAAMMRGRADEGALVLRRAVAQGHPLASVFAKRLESFERDRARYPTLKDFMPQLLSGLRADQLNGAPPSDDPGTRCSGIGPISIASAEVRNRPLASAANRDPGP